MLELGCELVFPIGEGSAAGMLFACGNLFGFLYGLILSMIVEGETKMQTLWGLVFCFCIFTIGLGLVYFLKEERNREKAESEMSERRKSLLSQTNSNSDSDHDSIRNTLLFRPSNYEGAENDKK